LLGLFVVAQYQALGAIRLRGWVGMSLLLMASLGIGWVCDGPGLATRQAMVMTTAVRNAAVGLEIATGNFADTPAVIAVVAYGLISTIGALGLARGPRRDHRTRPKRATCPVAASGFFSPPSFSTITR
jgi:BASS family bile acid:Na+ symporter